jgi:hypothetical protein
LKNVHLLILALALVALPLLPAGGAHTCVGYSNELGTTSECVDAARLADSPVCDVGFGAGCAYAGRIDIGEPACGDDGSGYACVVVLSTGYDAIGATCIVLAYGADAPYEGDEPVDTCDSGGWIFADDLAVTFRDIPAGGRDVTFEGMLAVGGYNDGDIGTTGTVQFWTAGTVRLPGA